MTSPRRAFYARPGTRAGDLITLLHLPYTMWHLSYVAIGAALAPDIDVVILIGTLIAFFFGLGVGAHALDELRDRPLETGFSPLVLRILAWLGMGVGGGLAVAAAFVISPTALVWGAAGILLATAYSLEWIPWIHSMAGFALSWGAFPVLVGYWAQTQSLSPAVGAAAAAATAFSAAQRTLSTPARHTRRNVDHAHARIGDTRWERPALLSTWERPLGFMAIAHVLLAVALLLAHAAS